MQQPSLGDSKTPILLTLTILMGLAMSFTGCSKTDVESTKSPRQSSAPLKTQKSKANLQQDQTSSIEGQLQAISKLSNKQIDQIQKKLRQRYTRFLIGNDSTFTLPGGQTLSKTFTTKIKAYIRLIRKIDLSQQRHVPFSLFKGDKGFEDEMSIYSSLLQRGVLSLAYAYNVNSPHNPYYQNPETLALYTEVMSYLYDRGIREGMTFHYNAYRQHKMQGAPQPSEGAANIVKMNLRMGAYCQAFMLMEPHLKDQKILREGRKTIKFLEMLGVSSGHISYFKPYQPPEGLEHLLQSDAVQIYMDVNLVSALIETDPARKRTLLNHVITSFSDTFRIAPGWADTIKPDFTGYHHRGIYGSAYTSGFIPQASFLIYLLEGTPFALGLEQRNNIQALILTYRLACQKYAMPLSIRGRMPLDPQKYLAHTVISGIAIHASPLGMNDPQMKGVFSRLWSSDLMKQDYIFSGGRGKFMRGLYLHNMVQTLLKEKAPAEDDPQGHWFKPYGGLSLHRRDDWMVSMKGFSGYIWDYEAGKTEENFYGETLSHGSLEIFSKTSANGDINSGYDLDNGWDWFRMPGTTAVHFPIIPMQKPILNRSFSPEVFLGGLSPDGRNGIFSFQLNDEQFGKTKIDLKAKKSAFFVDDTVVLLGSDISGGDGQHAVETTIFQNCISSMKEVPSNWKGISAQQRHREDAQLYADPAGHAYIVPKGQDLQFHDGLQHSVNHNGKKKTEGQFATLWLNHGLRPQQGSYEFCVIVNGASRMDELRESEALPYALIAHDERQHALHFPKQDLKMFSFFEAQDIDDELLLGVNGSCLVAYQKHDNGTFSLSAVDPDMNRLDKDKIREKSKGLFKFLNQEQNQYLPDRPVRFQIKIRAGFQLVGNPPQIKVLESSPTGTLLEVTTLGGVAQTLQLKKY